MGLGEARVSQLLKGNANTTLRSIADLGWALGYRFELVPVPLEDRRDTPAGDDPPPAPWVTKLRRHVAEGSSTKQPRLRRQ